MINLYELYKNKLRKFGVNDAERFRSSFVEALNLVYSELNAEVYRSSYLSPIDSFDDIIDSRLAAFTSIAMDSDARTAISTRTFWTAEFSYEKKSDTNGLTWQFTDGANSPKIVLLNNTITVRDDSGAVLVASGDIGDATIVDIVVELGESGLSVTANGGDIDLTYSVGSATTALAIGTVTADTISSVSGVELLKYRFLTTDSVVYSFIIDEETTNTNLTDQVNSFTATITSPAWSERYIEPSCVLSDQWRSVLDMGTDYHLQDGGEWAIEPEQERERKWYLRGLKMARGILQNESTYVGPLGALDE